jgi:hypothetical protein
MLDKLHVPRKLQLPLILAIVAALCSLVSHLTVSSLKIRSSHGGNHHYGPKDQKAVTILHGSSLAYSALDWDKVSERFGGPIESWATAGSSPTEWEWQHQRSPAAKRTIIVLSPYDLNEYILCDMRADIVPLSQAVSDLRRTGTDWPLSKRILSQYPVMLLRKPFPAVGRSDGVMTGIRDWLNQSVLGEAAAESEGVNFGPSGMSEVKEKLTDWSPARLQRRMALLRGACQGRHSFHGPKKLALMRLVERAKAQGPITFVVVPVSPIYQAELMNLDIKREFEALVSEVQKLCPASTMFRFDHIPTLQDNGLFSDTVHLNVFGQHIATAEFLAQLDGTRL